MVPMLALGASCLASERALVAGRAGLVMSMAKLPSGDGRGHLDGCHRRDRWVASVVRDEAANCCGAPPTLVAAHGALPGNMSGLQSGSPQLRSAQKTAVRENPLPGMLDWPGSASHVLRFVGAHCGGRFSVAAQQAPGQLPPGSNLPPSAMHSRSPLWTQTCLPKEGSVQVPGVPL